MTDHAAAVQIAAAALGYETHSRPGGARDVVAALARAGWLHDPVESDAARTEIERLRAERQRLRRAADRALSGDRRDLVALAEALDAAPAAAHE